MIKKQVPNLIATFLINLWRTDRKAFLFITTFLVLQVVLALMKLEVTPIFLYGMYSEKLPVTNRFSELKIFINDTPIETYRPSFRQKALLTTNAVNYEDMKRNDHIDVLKTRMKTKYPFLFDHWIAPVFGESIYNSAEDQEKFTVWFKQKCLEMAGITTGHVKLVKSTYLYNETTQRLNLIKHETLEDL
ncbi:MAG: hypothetical protein ABI415_08370 [Flavitalea sp.]